MGGGFGRDGFGDSSEAKSHLLEPKCNFLESPGSSNCLKHPKTP